MFGEARRVSGVDEAREAAVALLSGLAVAEAEAGCNLLPGRPGLAGGGDEGVLMLVEVAPPAADTGQAGEDLPGVPARAGGAGRRCRGGVCGRGAWAREYPAGS